MYKYKMKIVFDKAKVLHDNMNVDELYSLVDGMFDKLNLKVIALGEYIDVGGNEDYESMLAMMSALIKCDWVKKYTKEWIFEEEGEVDDLKKNLLLKASV